MKKSIIFILLSLISIFSVTAMSKKDANVELKGYIRMCGNEPFAYPCFFTDDDCTYAVRAKDDVKKALIQSQGNQISICGKIIPNEKNKVNLFSSKDGFIQVDDWKIIDQEQ